MNWKSLVFAMVAAFSANGSSHAVDTTRYALIATTSKMEPPQLPTLKAPPTNATRWWLRPSCSAADTQVKVAPGVVQEDENLMGWVPMSVDLFGYDIHQATRWENEVCTFGGLGFSR